MDSGEEDLSIILANLNPEFLTEDYVFISLNNCSSDKLNQLNPIATFKEKEGITLVITEEKAKKDNFEYNLVFKCITLGVHSSLKSVGLIATISKLFLDNGISCNVFSGYFHDHIFVQNYLSKNAMKLLKDINTK
tara:strand:+ start:1199 stop:1603 length:405 start_codon:yes stop_codon:yes gene_type:complete